MRAADSNASPLSGCTQFIRFGGVSLCLRSRVLTLRLVRALPPCYRGETAALVAFNRNLDSEECDMDEDRAWCPAVPAPDREPVTSLICQPEAWPAAIIAPGAMVCLGSDGSSAGVAAAGM